MCSFEAGSIPRVPLGVCGRRSCWRETPSVGYHVERAGSPEPLACRCCSRSCLAGREFVLGTSATALWRLEFKDGFLDSCGRKARDTTEQSGRHRRRNHFLACRATREVTDRKLGLGIQLRFRGLLLKRCKAIMGGNQVPRFRDQRTISC